MEFEFEAIARVFEELILPPGSILVILITGILLTGRKPRTSRFLLYTAFLALYLLSAPFFAGQIADRLETYPALAAPELIEPKPAAIVVLSANRSENANEYSGETVGSQTLRRLRYGAHLQRQTGLPILVSGGIPGENSGLTLAQLMAGVLRDEMNVDIVWREDQSGTTAENAIYSRQALKTKNIDRVFLITDAWHMPRSVYVFELAGFDVIPAPTGFTGRVSFNMETMLPQAEGLLVSRQSIREIGANIWYRIRFKK